MDSLILEILTGQQKSRAKLVNEDDLKSSKPSNFTATIKDITEVYAILPGEVLYVGYYEGMGTLSVLVSDKELVRYLNLTDIQVIPGQSFKKGTYLGIADKRYGLQFEYCSQWQGQSKMPVRLNNITYFKQNPIEVLEGLYVPEYHQHVTQGYVMPDDVVEMTDAQKAEFSSNMFATPAVYNEPADFKGITRIQDFPPEAILELTQGLTGGE